MSETSELRPAFVTLFVYDDGERREICARPEAISMVSKGKIVRDSVRVVIDGIEWELVGGDEMFDKIALWMRGVYVED